ncbi:MAG: hypothetical protein U5N85_15400 [Arcicella sp.]|nr:hypothetical protein [Arcicella sp.]
MDFKDILQHSQHLLVLLVVFILAKIFPTNKKEKDFKKYELEDIEQTYKKYKWLPSISIIVLLFLGVLLYYSLKYISILTSVKPDDAVFYLRFETMPLLLTVCLIFTFSISIMENIMLSMMSQEDYEKYNIKYELEYGLSANGGEIFVKYWKIIFGSITVFLLFWLWNMDGKITKDSIELGEEGTTAKKKYLFNQVKTIQFYPNPNPDVAVLVEDEYKVIFVNNDEWHTSSGIRGTENLSEVMQYISDRSKVRIDTLTEQKNR